KLKEKAPAKPCATVSTEYSTVFAGRGARVCPSHAGIGAYPSGAALSPAGVPAAWAGGRGAALIVCPYAVTDTKREAISKASFLNIWDSIYHRIAHPLLKTSGLYDFRGH